MYWTCSCHHWHGQSSSPHGCVLTTAKHCLMLGVPFQQKHIWPAGSKPTTQSLKGPTTAREQAATHTPACCTCRSFCRRYPRPPLPAWRACRGSWRQPWSAEAGAEEPPGSRCWCAGRTSPCCSGSLPRPGPQWHRRTCRTHITTGLPAEHTQPLGYLQSTHSHWVTCRAHTTMGYLQGTHSHWVTCKAHTAIGLPALGYLQGTHNHWVTWTGLPAGHTQPLVYLQWPSAVTREDCDLDLWPLTITGINLWPGLVTIDNNQEGLWPQLVTIDNNQEGLWPQLVTIDNNQDKPVTWTCNHQQ